VHHAKETNFEHLLTGDGLWLYYEYPRGSTWVSLTATFPTRKAQKIQTKKCLVSIIWSTSSIHSLLALPAGMRYGAEFFMHLFCLTSKGILATASGGRRFEVSTAISMMHQLTTLTSGGKKCPKPKPPGLCIRFIPLMLHPVMFSCLAT
jgi:hypothetical protein